MTNRHDVLTEAAELCRHYASQYEAESLIATGALGAALLIENVRDDNLSDYQRERLLEWQKQRKNPAAQVALMWALRGGRGAPPPGWQP